MRKFTKKEQSKIIKMYLDTEDIDKIMKEFNSEERPLRLVLKENQIDRYYYNRFSEELYARIIKLYSIEDKKIVEISNDLIISESVIRKHIDRNNIPRKGSTIGNRKYARNSHYFDSIDTPNKAYILGLLYADGCNYYDKGKSCAVTISLQEGDKAILEKIKEELEYEGVIRFSSLHEKNFNYKNQYVLTINDSYMSLQLKKLGVVRAKSLKVKFPNFLPDNLLRHFIRGYFDGDGNIYYYQKKNKCSTQTVGTLDFCQKISQILNSMGIKNNIKHPKQCSENTFVIATSGNKSSYNFLYWMYENAEMKLDRKYYQYLDFCKLYSKSHINLNQSNELIK